MKFRSSISIVCLKIFSKLPLTLILLICENLKRIDVIDANIIRDRILLELAENQFRAGVATRIDVTRAEVQIATDEKERLQQETLILESELQIKRLLKLDLESDLTLEDIELKSPDRSRSFNYDIDSILDLRPDFIEASLELTRDRYAKKAAQWERLPSIELFGEIGYVTEEIFDGNEDDAWVVGIFVSLPIFEGLRMRSNKLEANCFNPKPGISYRRSAVGNQFGIFTRAPGRAIAL